MTFTVTFRKTIAYFLASAFTELLKVQLQVCILACLEVKF